MLQLTSFWFSRLSAKPLEFLLELAQQPFLEIRCGSHAIMAAVANQEWAQRLFDSHATFKEYLLNRSTETEKEGKEGKYEIVKTLVESPTTMDVMGRVYLVKLKEYVREGPYFVRTESAVAMESRD